MKQKHHMKDLKHEHGEVAPHRIPIYDHKGNMRGHVGRTATGATVARFLGRHGAELSEKDGRQAWIGSVPPPPPPPMMPPTSPMDDARGEAEIGLINAKRDALARGPDKPKAKPAAKR